MPNANNRCEPSTATASMPLRVALLNAIFSLIDILPAGSGGNRPSITGVQAPVASRRNTSGFIPNAYTSPPTDLTPRSGPGAPAALRCVSVDRPSSTVPT